MKFYPVDETGTPLSATKSSVTSSQHSYAHQSNNPVKTVTDVIRENIMGDPYSANSATKNLKNSLGISSSSGGGSGGGSSGVGASGESGFVVKDGKVGFANKDLQNAMQMIQQTAAANNAWSAEQAQKQMDFQLMMSNTAHQREVDDLRAAGLNPVLSAGGQGAAVMSGAMGQTDESNTRLIADLAMVALESIGSTAIGVAGAAGGSSSKVPYALRRFTNALAGAGGYQVARWLGKAIFKV